MLSRFSSPQLPRILAVSMTVVFLLVLMVPAVFADSYNIISFDLIDGSITPQTPYIPEGLYDVTFVLLDPDPINFYSVDPVDVNYFDSGTEFYFQQVVVFFNDEFGNIPLELTLISLSGTSTWGAQLLTPEGEYLPVSITFSLTSESSAVSQFFVYTTTTLSAVVSWFGNLIDSFIGENGALSVLFPFVAIGFTIALVYIGFKLVRQFVPGF